VGPRHSAPNVAPYSALIVTEPEQNITDLVQNITDLDLIADIGKKSAIFFRIFQSQAKPIFTLKPPNMAQKVPESAQKSFLTIFSDSSPFIDHIKPFRKKNFFLFLGGHF